MTDNSTLLAFRLAPNELKFFLEHQKQSGLNKTQFIRYCIHKALINSNITVDKYEERLF